LEARYSPLVRQLIVWASIPSFLLEDGVRIYATGIFLHEAVGLSLAYSIVIVSLVMVFYTFLGGVWAVSVTGVIQFVVLSSALVILLPLSIRAVGGFGSLVRNSPHGFFHLTNSVGAFYLITFFLLFCVSYNTRWSLVQRYYCVRTDRDARKLGVLTGFCYIIGTVFWIVPVIASRQILPHLPNPDFAFAALGHRSCGVQRDCKRSDPRCLSEVSEAPGH
jgi:solute:Na+ symporter, SSS family